MKDFLISPDVFEKSVNRLIFSQFMKTKAAHIGSNEMHNDPAAADIIRYDQVESIHI